MKSFRWASHKGAGGQGSGEGYVGGGDVGRQIRVGAIPEKDRRVGKDITPGRIAA